MASTSILQLHLPGFEFSNMTSTVIYVVALVVALIILPVLSKDVVLKGSRVWSKINKTPLESSDIVSLMIYPIKSCRGIRLNKTTLRSQGLDLDRRWILVEGDKNEFITIRNYAELTLINTELSEDGEILRLSVPSDINKNNGYEIVEIPSRPSEEWLKKNTKLERVKIWDVVTDGYVYGEEVNGVISRFLQKNVCLVYKGPTPRVIQGNGDPRLLGRVQTVNFADGQPVLIGSEASLNELNSRLTKSGENPITVERFRPNIIIKGNIPWSEDSWKLVRVRDNDKSTEEKTGGLELDILSRCMRCQVPNVNPETGYKNNKQPWETLMGYRRIDEGMKFKPVFGMNAAPRKEGEIRVGMKLEVLEETDKHFYIKSFQ